MNSPVVLSQEFVAPLSPELRSYFSTRGRRQLETSVLHKGEHVGKLTLTVVTDMFPTPHERTWMWGHDNSPRSSGIYIKTLAVPRAMRGQGIGSLLLHEAIKLARTTVRHLYVNVPAGNMRLRNFLRSSGFRENIFWFTPDHTLTVRYIW